VLKELDGIHIGGISINNILYADDYDIADSEAKLQNIYSMLLLWKVNRMVCINRQKSVCMVISKSLNTPPCNVTVNGDKIEQVDQFSYLGNLITRDSRCDKEIKCRIGISIKRFSQHGESIY